jgi:hypothetical protein
VPPGLVKALVLLGVLLLVAGLGVGLWPITTAAAGGSVSCGRGVDFLGSGQQWFDRGQATFDACEDATANWLTVSVLLILAGLLLAGTTVWVARRPPTDPFPTVPARAKAAATAGCLLLIGLVVGLAALADGWAWTHIRLVVPIACALYWLPVTAYVSRRWPPLADSQADSEQSPS